jgi:tRNA (Thr-GGU) A37 N-methylase
MITQNIDYKGLAGKISAINQTGRRPNPIGLTVVALLRREASELHVRGVDMPEGTPLLDIKPLLSSVLAEKLRRVWLAEAEARRKR